MKVCLIAAMDENLGIGKDNSLPWPMLKDDMAHFKSLTEGWPVIMGRNTYLSIPKRFRPLKNRVNIVLTRTLLPHLHKLDQGARFATSLNIALIGVPHFDKVWIIGGAQVYREALEKDLVDEMYLTHIRHAFDCDTNFPLVPQDAWESKFQGGAVYSDKGLKFLYEFVHYRRVRDE